MLRRAWINQPSALQPLHRLHGANVLADGNRVWFLEGDTISMEVHPGALSGGWLPKRAPYYLCAYHRTNKIKPRGKVFNCGNPAIDSLPLAPVYVYRLKRVSGAIMLTPDEYATLRGAMEEAEGNAPMLYPEHEAIEGKEL